MRLRSHALFAFLLSVAGCSSSSAPTAPAHDAGGEAAAGGDGGLCCPLDDPCDQGGGWAPSASQCMAVPNDGCCKFAVDSHGCKLVASCEGTPGGSCDVCCGCPPQADAGSNDARAE